MLQTQSVDCCCLLLHGLLPVQSLFESGMLDAAEQSLLAHPIEAAERRLELLGPVWKAPSLSEVLRQLPFMRGQSTLVLSFFIK